MQSYNSGSKEEAVGLCGMDLYSMVTSMKAVVTYLETVEHGTIYKGSTQRADGLG